MDFNDDAGFGDIALELEQEFGSAFTFGHAGGCVNMITRLESGHVVNITDADVPYLTHPIRRTDVNGFTVGIYTADQWEGSDYTGPAVYLTRHTNVDGLPRIIHEALAELIGIDR